MGLHSLSAFITLEFSPYITAGIQFGYIGIGWEMYLNEGGSGYAFGVVNIEINPWE